MKTWLISLAALLCAACGSSEPADSGGPDSPGAADAAAAIDARAEPARLPLWALQDIQPESPRFGQTYSLSEFPNEVLVVLLVEGF